MLCSRLDAIVECRTSFGSHMPYSNEQSHVQLYARNGIMHAMNSDVTRYNYL